MGQMLLRFFLMKFTKTYKTLKEVPLRIPETKIYWTFRKWKESQGLPVWRRGNTLKCCPKFIWTKYVYTPSNVAFYKKNNTYYTSYHKNVPSIAWKRNIRKILRRLGLSWIKPKYELPIWLSMYIFNHDVCWKDKWDEPRFEFPPQFSIVMFGWSLLFWINPKKDNLYKKGRGFGGFSIDFWWESILREVYYGDKK